MKNAWKYLVAIGAIFLIGKTYGFVIATLLLLVLIAVLLYVRRAALFTKQAMSLYYLKGNTAAAAEKFEKAYKTGEMTPMKYFFMGVIPALISRMLLSP